MHLQAAWLRVDVKHWKKMERIDKPMIDARSANIQFGFDRNTGNDVMHIHDLKISYDFAYYTTYKPRNL